MLGFFAVISLVFALVLAWMLYQSYREDKFGTVMEWVTGFGVAAGVLATVITALGVLV